MFYIIKNPAPNTLATIEWFAEAPGSPWVPFDAAAQAWLEAAKLTFSPQ